MCDVTGGYLAHSTVTSIALYRTQALYRLCQTCQLTEMKINIVLPYMMKNYVADKCRKKRDRIRHNQRVMI